MKKMIVPAGILLLAGIVMLLLPTHVGMTGIILVLLGGAMLLYGLFYPKAGQRRRLCLTLLVLAASVGVVVLVACMNLINAAGETDWRSAREAQYAIVLGAGVREDGTPSRIMRQRLAAAMEFMEENPKAKVILSGGRGDDEPRSEAEVMYDTLLDMGADPSRLVQETESRDTMENLRNSMVLMDLQGQRRDPKKPVAIITSEFHQCRAAYLANRLGLETTPVSAHTDQWFYRVNYTLREVFALIKEHFRRGDWAA